MAPGNTPPSGSGQQRVWVFFFNNFSLKYHVQTEKCPYPRCMAESTFTSCVLSLAPDQENRTFVARPREAPRPHSKGHRSVV